VQVSATSYVSYRQCPAQAEARFRGIYGPESRASFTGALAHRIFARHLRHGPIADVGQAAREEIGSGLNPKLAPAGIGRPSDLADVIKQVGALYERFRRFPVEGFESAEVELEAEPVAGVFLVGKIDAVFRPGRGPILRDWKTGSLGEPLDQLMFYALVWALQRQEIPETVEAVSLQTGERMSSAPTERDLEEVAGNVVAMVAAVRAARQSEQELERRGGPWCRWCPLLPDCREGAAAASLFN
jgi:hypothetical protein